MASTGPAIKEKAYEKQNRKMRKDYTSETGKKLGSRQILAQVHVEFLLLVDLRV